jgi:hypothetical protein
MPDTTVAQPDAAPTDVSTETPTTAPAASEADPFAVDESQFVSLSPEQRAALDPVLNKWKESAKSYAQKERESEGKKYTSHIKKAEALEKLVADPRFVKWYNETNNPQKTDAPKSVASADEWAQAYQALSAGDPAPLEALQTKLVMSVGGPQLQATQQQMNMLRMENEMTKLFANHPDAKDLDQIGREEDPNAPSLLQLAAQSVMDKQGGTWEQAYALAASVAKAMENKGKRAAMGMVSEKKGSVTERPSTNSREEGVQYVNTIEEAMTANIEAAMDGRKVKYQVKK